ncbi:winged helix-turn-helix domain-containing protein [Marasmitruncus massiliensis]|jgi:molybdate transport system regulatory protein|uniref:winged helix-turn-helix domain-containing protein n=1 Tax=Marasmitruncus massiliensis TaxID=1944642 RepID=UPI000C7C992B|nr:LysR family transcriptional regulator [Marasmitruncus massiliensis]MBE6905954.1 LysR family transcriptional regulator [Oscillospiraceae bacterium]
MGLHYCIRLRLENHASFFGPGVEQILLLVDETGSLQTAAAQMEMSYSKAWKIIRHAEQELGFPLMERHVGGSGGGYSRLTPKGRDFVNRYTDFRQELCKVADGLFEKYFNAGEQDEKD